VAQHYPTKCFVYVILSESTARKYVGVTNRLRRRLAEHNAGRCKSTTSGRPWALIYREACRDHEHARQREKFLKSGVGRAWLSEQLSQGERGN
jgi:putative endonuclease